MCLRGCALCVVGVHSIGGGLARADSKSEKPDAVAVGYEIFNREWMPNDPRSHGGDGLGPVYNDSSCVACHNSGGSGGAGPVSKNIDILNASRNLAELRLRTSNPSGRQADIPDIGQPADRCPRGFRTSRTVVLHKFGIDPNYDVVAKPGSQFGSDAGISWRSPQSPSSPGRAS